MDTRPVRRGLWRSRILVSGSRSGERWVGSCSTRLRSDPDVFHARGGAPAVLGATVASVVLHEIPSRWRRETVYGFCKVGYMLTTVSLVARQARPAFAS
jgi:hypothetical protein